MAGELSSTPALATGGTSGIGRPTSVALERLGAQVALSGLDKNRGKGSSAR